MSTEALRRVSHQHPCPVCKKTDWCSVSADGALCICMRVESGKGTRNGGWTHILKDSPPPMRVPWRSAPPPAKRPAVELAAYHARLRASWTPDDLAKWAEELGVWEYALEALQPAWDAVHEALAFPMRNGAGAVTGIRLRNAEGRKWAVTGGTDGLFYAPEMIVDGEIVVCEGPTDAAAALSIDLPVVGRPSCSSGVAAILDLVKRLRVRQVTIISDNDEPHERPDGSTYLPGLDGARKLGAELKRMYRIVTPPAKDIRRWFIDGMTRADFDALAKNATWRMS